MGADESKYPILHTARLCLRPWRAEDVDAFAAMSVDPHVMEFFPKLLDRAECDAAFERVTAHFAKHGFGFWAAELPGVAPFIGFIGLAVPRFEAHFTPCVEVGWRLAAEHWGRGYATEGARAALAFGFQRLKSSEILAYAVPANRRSLRVMEKLGMTHAAGDEFDHPQIAEGHPLQRHVIYRISVSKWAASIGPPEPA